MQTPAARLEHHARNLGLDPVTGFDPTHLVPEERIRDLCRPNKCGNYRTNHMCPPLVGTLDDARAQLARFDHAYLLQYTEVLNVSEDWEGVVRTKLELHEKILELEGRLRGEGLDTVWGLIGGSCGLCIPCTAAEGEPRGRPEKPCTRPEDARPSMEALGIDVLAVLADLGLDNNFHPDRITWTGCVLW